MATIVVPDLVRLGVRKVKIGDEIIVADVTVDMTGIETIPAVDLVGGNSVWVKIQAELRKMAPEEARRIMASPIPWNFHAVRSRVDVVGVLMDRLGVDLQTAQAIINGKIKITELK